MVNKYLKNAINKTASTTGLAVQHSGKQIFSKQTSQLQTKVQGQWGKVGRKTLSVQKS